MDSWKIDTLNSFGKRLLDARRATGMTQQELSNRSGVPAESICRFERKWQLSSVGNLIRLADALGVTTDYLLGRPTS